ncbi:MAG: hypothetical protein EOP48_00165 [Sphingobacteriales bacterium]|nr:MAG: hypothetical protein EOP48_00165 [Sphingobacteriales bacterium]
MKFQFGEIRCEADVFVDGRNVMVRFYDQDSENKTAREKNLVIVPTPIGFMSLKFTSAENSVMGQISGHLDERYFKTEDEIYAAIDFVKSHTTEEGRQECIYHHVDRCEVTDYVEYNGEYESIPINDKIIRS